MEQREFNSSSFYKYLGEGKFMGAKCGECNQIFVPPRHLCTSCQDCKLEWVELSGKGKLAAFTAISVAPTFMLNQGMGKNNPYCSGVVELEEGPKISALILGVDAKKPETIKVGTPLTIQVQERTEADCKIYTLAFKAV